MTAATNLLEEGINQELATDGIGGQLYVDVGGKVLVDVAVGSRAPPRAMVRETVHNVWCATKPVGAMAAGLLVDDGLIDPSSPLGSQVSTDSDLAGIKANLLELCNHRAGLAHPRAVEAQLAAEADRAAAVLTAVHRAPQEPAYSEYAGWAVLGRLLEEFDGIRGSEVVAKRTIEPLGLSDEMWFDLTFDELAARQDRIGCYVAGLPLTARPLLHDRTPEIACSERVAMGGFASMRALARFHRAVLDVLGGTPRAGLPQPSTGADDAGGQPGPVVGPCAATRL
ncbi:hypothetical protein BH20ACT2_BH20ACT2_03080 [soil metagenome]